jgi:hypothetical protein
MGGGLWIVIHPLPFDQDLVAARVDSKPALISSSRYLAPELLSSDFFPGKRSDSLCLPGKKSKKPRTEQD